jgi:hypothetical protein
MSRAKRERERIARRDTARATRGPVDMQAVAQKMQAVMQTHGAFFGVPANGRGFILFGPSPRPQHEYVNGGPDDGLLQTDAPVLVFTDVMVKPHSTQGEPPYCDPLRRDLCPNIKKVRLADYI